MPWQANCSASGSASPTDAAAARVLIDQLHAGASTWAGPVANLQSERSAEDPDGTLSGRIRWLRAFSLRLAQPHTRASPAVLIDEHNAGGFQGRPNASIEMRLLSFPLCHAKAEAAQLVIIDELDSGLFERCLDPNHCRNIASHCLVTFYSGRYGLRDTARVAG